MKGKKAKLIRRLVAELASPGVDRQAVQHAMKKAYNEMTHKQKKKSNLFSEHTA